MLGAAPNLAAQASGNFELGAGAGGSLYRDQGFRAAIGDGTTGFNGSFGAAAWLTQDLYDHISGEIRYLYEGNTMKLASGGQQVTRTGRSHTLTYELQIHLRGRRARLRPFVLGGAGARGYYGTGAQSTFQPLMDIAVLRRTSVWKPAVVFGGGVKYQVSRHLRVRAEIRDYLTPFPGALLVVAGGSQPGWVHNLVPTVGFGITF